MITKDTTCCPQFLAAYNALDGGAITEDDNGDLAIFSVRASGRPSEEWLPFSKILTVQLHPNCGKYFPPRSLCHADPALRDFGNILAADLGRRCLRLL